MHQKIKKYFSAPWLFLVIGLVFGLIFIKITPPFWGLDETTHFNRVYQITKGNLIPDTKPYNFGGFVPENLNTLGNYAIGDLVNNNFTGIAPRNDADNPERYKELQAQEFSTQLQHSQSTATYSPVAYIGAILGTFLAEIVHANIGHTIFSARFSSLLLYLALATLAIFLVRDLAVRWLFFTISLLPTVIFQASVITADSTLIGFSLLFTALLIRVLKTKGLLRPQLLYPLVLVAILLPLIKLNYVFLSFALLAIPYRQLYQLKYGRLIVYGGVLLAIVMGAGWSSLANVTAQAPVSQRPDHVLINASDQTTDLVQHPLHFAHIFVNTLLQNTDAFVQQGTILTGWNYVSIPFTFIIIISLQIFVCVLMAQDEFILLRKRFAAIAVVLMLGVMSIFAALYVSFTPPGSSTIQGVQGRYFLPFLIPLLLLISTVLPIKLKVDKVIAPFLFAAITFVCLSVSVAYYVLITY